MSNLSVEIWTDFFMVYSVEHEIESLKNRNKIYAQVWVKNTFACE